mmetsp:Transcript_40765/g.70592  ORF Transcript_40765/g.70592 Transcript_40765/m.70592 type:complete len:221 (-) Transcript_40765:1510-2172(-)
MQIWHHGLPGLELLHTRSVQWGKVRAFVALQLHPLAHHAALGHTQQLHLRAVRRLRRKHHAEAHHALELGLLEVAHHHHEAVLHLLGRVVRAQTRDNLSHPTCLCAHVDLFNVQTLRSVVRLDRDDLAHAKIHLGEVDFVNVLHLDRGLGSFALRRRSLGGLCSFRSHFNLGEQDVTQTDGGAGSQVVEISAEVVRTHGSGADLCENGLRRQRHHRRQEV